MFANNSTLVDSCDEYDIISNYVKPMIIVIGLVGNITAVVIFFCTNLKMRSSSIYLGSLSISDAGYLLMLGIFHFNYNTDVFCQISIFVASVFSSFSVWITVAFTVERFIVVKFPLKRPQVCTVSRAKSITLRIITLTVISQLCLLWTSSMRLSEDDQFWECGLRTGYEHMMEIFNYVDTVVNLVIPLFSIIILNILIVKYLRKYQKKLCIDSDVPTHIYSIEESMEKNMQLSQLDSKPGTSTEYSSASCRISVVHDNRKNVMIQCQRNVTHMLLVISTAFIILNTPSYIIRLCIFAIDFHAPNNEQLREQISCYQRFCMILFYLNHGINFILYSLYGATFRKTMLKYFLSKWRSTKAWCRKYLLCK